MNSTERDLVEAMSTDKSPELVKALADRTFYAQTLEKLRSTLHNVTDAIEDEGDRRYFGSTNDADELSAIAEQIEGLLWDEIIDQGNPPRDLYAEMRAMNAEIASIRAERDAAVAASVADVVAERERQKAVEGWTPEHDDEHKDGELARAAACYALGTPVRHKWPWGAEWWKPGDRRRNLVKAGALILAEIDRLDRAARAIAGEQTNDA